MNYSELCPEGKEKYAQWMIWLNYRNIALNEGQPMYINRSEQETHQNYKKHLQSCKICGKY